jgi:hypothetical protein
LVCNEYPVGQARFLEGDFHEKVIFVKPDVAGSPHFSSFFSKIGIHQKSKQRPASTTPLPHLAQASKKPPKNIWGFFDGK